MMYISCASYIPLTGSLVSLHEAMFWRQWSEKGVWDCFCRDATAAPFRQGTAAKLAPRAQTAVRRSISISVSYPHPRSTTSPWHTETPTLSSTGGMTSSTTMRRRSTHIIAASPTRRMTKAATIRTQEERIEMILIMVNRRMLGRRLLLQHTTRQRVPIMTRAGFPRRPLEGKRLTQYAAQSC